jgi:hypothetical protein
VVSSCFTYTWDVKLDWGLFDSSAGENKFLREEIVYSSPVSFFSYSIFYYISNMNKINCYINKYLAYSIIIILPWWRILFYDLDGHFLCP